MIDEIIDLLERLPKGLSGSERESLRAQLLRLMNAQSSNSNLYAPAEVGTDSDKLDGQHGSYYQDASNINAGTLSTDRYSAYTDLGAESKIGAGAAQVAAGDHAHAGVIVNPMTTAGDMIYQPGSLTVNNSDPTGNKIINESPSSTEKIIPICDLTIPDPVGNITINWDVWVSMNQLGTQKKVTVNLRRDSVTGAVLWTQEQIMATDSVLGHDKQYTSSFIDTHVTTGRYVLTTDATGASTVAIYGDTRTFSLSGTTNTPYRLPIGQAGYVLTVNAGATSPEYANKGVTNGDSHDHSGGDGAQINHTTLSSIGVNNHATLDSFVASKAAASGLASLDASSLVVQNPANATATPTASKIPIADANKTVDSWLSIAPSNLHGIAPNPSFRSLSALPNGRAWAGTPFITPPTVTYLSEGMRCTGYTVASRSFVYKAYTANQRNHWAQASVYRLDVGGYVGFRIDDGTDNNYVELVQAPQSDGSFGFTRRTRTGGGAPVVTMIKSFVTPIPWAVLYCYLNGTLHSAWGVDFYLNGPGIPFYSIGSGGTALTWTPTRVGFAITVVTASASYLYANIDSYLE